MLLEYNGRQAFWGALIGLLLTGAICFGSRNYGVMAATAFLAILPMLFSATLFMIYQSDKKISELTKILYEKRNEVAGGEVYFEGKRLTPDVQVVQFRVVISAVFWSYSIYSKPHTFHTMKPKSPAYAYSALSLLLGIWSRKGLFLTPGSIIDNLNYEGVTTIGELCLRMESWGKPVKIS